MPMSANAIMIQGTTSDAGKSLICTGLCRVLHRMGVRVAPFKPQNMALNSAVTVDHGEIGRAQAVQALACGLEPHSDMNPVLLKPNTDTGAQVIVNGKALMDMDAETYHQYKPQVLQTVLASFDRLRTDYDAVVIEGAGSPAEINLRDRDIANMGFAQAADCPVVIVADIDRGGVFAHLYGTLALLSTSEQARVQGFIINRFRGDIKLLQSGLDWLEEKTAKPVLGVIPYLHGLHLEAEDGVDTQQFDATTKQSLKVVVPIFSRMSNHTDFDVLRLHPQVDISFIYKGKPLPPADLIILPGTKNTRADLDFMRQNDWDKDLFRHLRFGGKVMGICGGYQMLGQKIHDPDGVEGAAGSSIGLGLLAQETVLKEQKQLRRVVGTMQLPEQEAVNVTGYEIHAGTTTPLEQPLIQLEQHQDGAGNEHVFGSYLHGIFDHPEACNAILHWAGLKNATVLNYDVLREEGINRIADAIEAHLDMNVICRMISTQGS